jgi:hypothetical protein
MVSRKHLMNVKIEDVGNHLVRVTLIVERHFKNIGSRPVLHRAMIWVDDWGFTERAKILRCTISNSRGTRTKSFDRRKIEYICSDPSPGLKLNPDPGPGIKAQSPSMLLFRGHTVIAMFEYSVVKHDHDQFIEWWLAPTRNPEVSIIEKPPDMEVTVNFPGDQQTKATSIPDRYELDGVYFPPAVMKVRWWPKAAVANWPPK